MRYTLITGFLAVGLFISACAPGDPLGKISAADRDFLFAGKDTNAAFMGQPADAGPIACNPQRMNQGYVLMDEESGLWLDSIRPSGIERHKILAVEPTEKGFEVRGQNGVGVSFSLIIEKISDETASISWDGAMPEKYLRCPGMPA
ncbi:hypothetical protein [Aquidulcibacter sp.]|uniref:hypothetical protein n=1 Tax=Aquidulcibacter sp. TaxID=2052990 RepID=UPI0025BBE3E5|nr:hypothetical protein [Aquidulcibacter sp.]MCA3693394.1 hypothetical protein [Aquidulcibacter sp.]